MSTTVLDDAIEEDMLESQVDHTSHHITPHHHTSHHHITSPQHTTLCYHALSTHPVNIHYQCTFNTFYQPICVNIHTSYQISYDIHHPIITSFFYRTVQLGVNMNKLALDRTLDRTRYPNPHAFPLHGSPTRLTTNVLSSSFETLAGDSSSLGLLGE